MKAKYILLFSIMMITFSSLTFASQLTDFEIPDGLTQTEMNNAITYFESLPTLNYYYLFVGSDDAYYLFGTELPFIYNLDNNSYSFSTTSSDRAVYLFSDSASSYVTSDAIGGYVTLSFQILNSTVDIYDSDGELNFRQPSALLSAVTRANPTQIVSLSLGSVVGGILLVTVLSVLFWKPLRFLFASLRKA